MFVAEFCFQPNNTQKKTNNVLGKKKLIAFAGAVAVGASFEVNFKWILHAGLLLEGHAWH